MRHFRAAPPALLLAALAACSVPQDPPDVSSCKGSISYRSTLGAVPTMTVLSNETTTGGKLLRIREEETGTTWRCVTDPNGLVTDLSPEA